jgi:hypothetical protein
MTGLLVFLPLLAACLAAAGEPAGPPAAAPATAEDMVALIDEYAADERSVSHFYEIGLSPTRLDRQDALAETWRSRLDEVGFESLQRPGQVDWLALRTHLEHGGRQRRAQRERLAETSELVPFAASIIAFEEGRWRLEPIDPESAAIALDGLGQLVETVRERVAEGHRKKPKDDQSADGEPPEAESEAAPTDDSDEASTEGDATEARTEEDEEAEPPPLSTTAVVARRAAGQVDELREALASWYRHYDAFRPGFSWWCEPPYEAVRKQLSDYAKLLRETVAGLKGEDDDPLIGDPIGREALLDDLAGELIAYSPEELLSIGEREFAWCEEQMLAAAAELGHGEDWQAALAAVKENHVEPGEQDALVVQQSLDAIAFLDERDLVTIPDLCRETWRVRMIDERAQRTLPFAAYGGQDMLVAYPTAVMDTETKQMTMRGNNVHFSRIVVPHELIPGHHLQGYMAGRYNTHRRPFGTPFLGEGWALYWEMVLWDAGYPRGPEDRIGMLFWRMHRAARIIVSLKFHLGEMTPQEMIDFLVERVGHEEVGATSEVRRYIGGGYGPLYQCAYMIGGLQLRALHEELVGGGALTDRQFHDAVLQQNSLPVELIRAALSDVPLSPDWQPSWRFAGDV